MKKKKKKDSYKYRIKGHTLTSKHVHVSSLSRNVQSPEFAHNQPSRSGLAENHCHGCTTDVSHDSGPTNSGKTRILMNIKGDTLTLIYVHVSSLSRGVHSPDFACGQPSRSGLGENHCHGCTNDAHYDSGPTNSEKTKTFTKFNIASKAILSLLYMYMYLL